MEASHFVGRDVDGIVALVLIFFAALATLHVVALVQSVRAIFRDGSTKGFWIPAILLMPLLGSLLWFAVGKSQTVERPLTEV